MTIYWLLFAFAAVMALTFPVSADHQRIGPIQSLAFVGFLSAYVLVAGLRDEIGGDWITYADMLDEVSHLSLLGAMGYTDPAFGAILWSSSRLGLGVYLANGICAALLAYGTLRISLTTREPWMGILIAVPYLFIVVGMGYVRQAAAIGTIMIAIGSLNEVRRVRTIVTMALAAALHSTASVTFPLVVQGLVARRRVLATALLAFGIAAFLLVISLRFSRFESGYLDSEYDSSGALARILMTALPSMLLLARWRYFPYTGLARRVWLLFAIAGALTPLALWLSPSSTAVDRVTLYFAPVQVIVFGSLRELLGLSTGTTYFLRMMGVALAALVQTVWLLLATNADFWVPYHSVLDTISAAAP